MSYQPQTTNKTKQTTPTQSTHHITHTIYDKSISRWFNNDSKMHQQNTIKDNYRISWYNDSKNQYRVIAETVDGEVKITDTALTVE